MPQIQIFAKGYTMHIYLPFASKAFFPSCVWGLQYFSARCLKSEIEKIMNKILACKLWEKFLLTGWKYFKNNFDAFQNEEKLGEQFNKLVPY